MEIPLSYPSPSGTGGRSYPQPPPPPGASAGQGSGGGGGNKALVVAVVFLGFAVLVAAAVVFFTMGRGAEGEGSPDASQEDAQGSGGESGGGQDGGQDDAAAEDDAGQEPQDTVVFDDELTVEVASPQSYIDLDTDPPLVTDARVDGYDFVLRPNINGVAFENSSGGIAPLPEGAEAPDKAACLDAVETNGTTGADFTPGARFCVQTDQGRVASVEAVSSPGGTGTATLQATVWE
ncbi:hypothetical protein O4J56_02600 [Nocardiopsis sp. RSe5-2]|uniref:Uncharacterized protein n=1 Tax=Nocardiopsis endophytica TaxID=3018445 RepID=A0ABT4TXU8_9ACTN|nr:hypothetical protein [Nocardiopsis endophytica]MDA2809518.1 hypothetical protein [Nocardiopsis endophytica]